MVILSCVYLFCENFYTYTYIIYTRHSWEKYESVNTKQTSAFIKQTNTPTAQKLTNT